jgi:tyrosinase
MFFTELTTRSRFALGGRPFVVRIFLGDVPDGNNVSFSFANTPTQVGNVFNFSSPSSVIGSNTSGCNNCKRQEQTHARMTGQVIITDTLVEHIQRQITQQGMQLHSLAREDVVAYLKKNLHWRITDVSVPTRGFEQFPSCPEASFCIARVN